MSSWSFTVKVNDVLMEVWRSTDALSVVADEKECSFTATLLANNGTPTNIFKQSRDETG